jgi:hypothetical protein
MGSQVKESSERNEIIKQKLSVDLKKGQFFARTADYVH